MAVKNGMDPERALTAITIYPAQIAGIAHRVGSLSPGKDADIVVTRGHPLDLNSRVQLVYCAGQRVDK
jgi:imidazolonepropionase-like amidohydrolase